ncbi:MAG: hypothetical protein AB8G16_19040 [Gammaproteobacteria bacterium]
MSIDYGIEWAYGEFRIARLKGSSVVESWKSPQPVTDLNSLSAAMREACNHLDISRGGSVAIAYEDDLHKHEFLEVPPLSRSDMRKFVARHVDNDKPFDDPATFRYHTVSHGEKQQDGILLHLMPRYIVDAVTRICEDFYLTPKLMVPLTEIMSEYVRSMSRKDDDSLLLIALFDDRTQMVISSAHGDILFVRELTYPWSEATEHRLATDINRTIGFAKQRIGTRVGGAWLIGELATRAKSSLSPLIETSLGQDAATTVPEFWMTQVAALPLRIESNFIPTLARSSISYKTFLRTAVTMVGITAVGAALFSATVEYTIYSRLNDQYSIAIEIDAMRDELARKNAEIESMQNQKSTLDLLNVDAFNLPALFLSHLGDLVPADLVLTEATVSRSNEGWEIGLQGRTGLSLQKVAPMLNQLQSNLTDDPWHAMITMSWEETWMRQLDAGSATSDGDIGFEIQGRFQ